MRKEPLVSVIIPCYNGERFIRGAIESVIAQSYGNWELIVVNDASTDASGGIVREYTRDNRIRLIENERNTGIPGTKNRGVLASRGEYIAFLDQDDLWMTEKLALQIEAFEGNEGIGVVCTGMIFTDEDLNQVNIFPGFDDSDQRGMLKNLYIAPINSSSIMMIRRDCMAAGGPFDESLKGWDDYELLMRLATGWRVAYVKKPLVKKRLHRSSAQRSSDVIEETERVFEKILELHPFLARYRDEREAAHLFNESVVLMGEGRKETARRMIRRCIGLKPLQARNWVLYLISMLPGRSPARVVEAIFRTTGRTKLILHRRRYA